MTTNSSKLEKFLNSEKRQECLTIEEEIFSEFFKKEEFISADMILSDYDFIHFTTIKKVMPSEDNVMIVLHGFGGWNAVFAKLAQKLSGKFHLILVDLPAMGFCMRPTKEVFRDTESAFEFFVSKLLTFIDNLGIKQFHLMGHSIGGLFASHVFERIKERVLRLFLLSPAGFNPVGTPSFERRKEHFLKNLSFIKRYFINKVEYSIYVKKESPFEIFWAPSWLKRWFFKKYWSHHRFNLGPEQSNRYAKIQAYLFSLPQFGERCLGHILHYGINSHKPILDVLKRCEDHSLKTRLFFGELDWMDKEDVRESINLIGLNIPFHIIRNSEHQMIFQNTEQISEIILNEIKDPQL